MWGVMSKRESAAFGHLASSPYTDPAVLSELAWHENWLVRVAVAENPSTPVSVLEEMASRSEGMAQTTAKHMLQLRTGKTFSPQQ